MPSIVVTPPAPIVTTDEAKKHVRFSAADDDAYIASLVAAATAYLDGPAGILGRAIGSQVLEEQRTSFPDTLFGVWDADIPSHCLDGDLFIVRCPPIIELTEVSYLDDLGQRQTLDVASLDASATTIAPPAGGWPNARRRIGSVKVRYQAGYETVPPNIKHAILLMVGTLYANREATIETAFSGAASALLSPFARVA